MKTMQRIDSRLALVMATVMAVVFCGASPVAAATRTWDGGGTTANWSDVANWDGDATAPSATGDNLTFSGVTRQANTNDAVVTSINIFTLNNGGWDIDLGGSVGITTMNATDSSELTGNITMSGGTPRTISLSGTTSTLTLGGKLTLGRTDGMELVVNGVDNTLALGSLDIGLNYWRKINAAANVIVNGAMTGGNSTKTVTKLGAGTLTLNGINTYASATTISAGTFALGASASINNTPSITIDAGGTFDVSTQSAYTLSTNLTASGSNTVAAATIKGASSVSGGTVSLGGNTVTLNWGGASSGVVSDSPPLTVTDATLVLNDDPITINVLGDALGNGVYTLISAPAGISGTISGTTPTYTGSGTLGGVSGELSISGNSVILTIAVPEVEPGVTSSTPIAISTTAATIGGVLTNGGSCAAWICWGASDGGTDSTGSWAHVESVGTVYDDNAFSAEASVLATNATYWFRCYVTNSAGVAWSDVATAFSGNPVGGGGAGGGSVPGAQLVVIASEDPDTSDDIWPNVADSPDDLEYRLDTDNGVTYVTGVSTLPGIAGAYDMPGGATDTTKGALLIKASDDSPQDFETAGWHTSPVSIEIWFKPDSTNHTKTFGQILFETGGGSGLGIYLKDNTLVGAINAYYSAGGNEWAEYTGVSTNGFCQAVVTYDLNDFKLFVNGQFVDSHSYGVNDWSGTDDSGLGTRGGSNAGGCKNNPVSGDLESFDGKIAILRAYKRVLSASEVLTNYNAIASSAFSLANLAPTNITANSAWLNASLTTGDTNCTVYVHWGTSNVGTNWGWQHDGIEIGSYDGVSTNISYPVLLSPSTTYYYTFRASNDAGNVWASPSWSFTTLADMKTGTVFRFR